MFAKTEHERITLTKVEVGDRLSTRINAKTGRIDPEKGEGRPRVVAEKRRTQTPVEGGQPKVEYVLVFTDGRMTEPRYGTTSHYRMAAEVTADEGDGLTAEQAIEQEAEEEAQLEAGIIDSGLVVHDGDLDAALADLAAELHLEEALDEQEQPGSPDPASREEPAEEEVIDPAPLPPADKQPKAARKKADPVPAGPDVTLELSTADLAQLYATMGRFGWREFDAWGELLAPFDEQGEPFPEPPVLPARRVGKVLDAVQARLDWLAKAESKGKTVSGDLVDHLRALHSRIESARMHAELAAVAPEPAAV